MKKIFFVALAATLLAAGCQKTEIINPVGEPSMSFTTGMNKLTKATTVADGTKNLQTQHFSVWAYAAYEDENTTATEEMNAIYDGINNLEVKYDSANNGWYTDKEYYWPGVGKDLRFFAVSAEGSWLRPTTGDAPVEVSVTDSKMTITDFTVDPADPNEDLMVADFVQQNQKAKAVDLKFHHALSKVEFVFKTSASTDGTSIPDVFVQKLEVKELANVGTLTVTPQGTNVQTADGDETTEGGNTEPGTGEGAGNGDDNGTTVPTYAPTVTLAYLDWGATQTGSELFADAWEAEEPTFPAQADLELLSGETYDNKALKLTTDAKTFTTWLMLPQSIVNKKVEITYVINKRQFKSIFALETASLPNWACNQYIKYTIVLAPNVISFNPSVEDWDTATDVGHTN